MTYNLEWSRRLDCSGKCPIRSLIPTIFKNISKYTSSSLKNGDIRTSLYESHTELSHNGWCTDHCMPATATMPQTGDRPRHASNASSRQLRLTPPVALHPWPRLTIAQPCAYSCASHHQPSCPESAVKMIFTTGSRKNQL